MANVTVSLALVFMLAICSGCSGSSSGSADSPPQPTTGTLSVTGSATATNALGIIALASSPKATIDGAATSVKIKAYKVYLAQNADCSSPMLVGEKTAADYQELVAATKPILFSSASVTPGTYHCMILKLSDIIKFTPDQTAVANSSGWCTAGTEVAFDVLKAETPPISWYDLDSNSMTTGEGTFGASIEQTVFLAASTNAAAVTGPLTSQQVLTITNPVVITAGQTTKTALVIDTAQRISVIDMGVPPSYCWLEGFSASFVTQ